MSQFMVGRQPIFDAKLDVRGYELLFRDPSFPVLNGDAMTADVLVHAGLDVGLRSLVGDKLAFVNATRAFLVGEQEFPFPPGQTVIEVLEDVRREPEVVAGCRRLVDSGYRLALDDYVWEQDDPLLVLVSIVKLDVLALTPAQLEHAVSQRGGFDVQLVAEKVETRQQLNDCQEMGFDLYQGYLLSRPEVVEGETLSPSRVTCLKVIEKLCDPDTSARELEPGLADAAYTVGLVSALGLLLHVSITQIVESLSLSRELEGAVLEHSGVLGGIMADVLAWEVGGENFHLRSGAPPEAVERCYLHALTWANEICGVLALTS